MAVSRVPGDLGGCVESGRGKRHPLGEGEACEFRQGDAPASGVHLPTRKGDIRTIDLVETRGQTHEAGPDGARCAQGGHRVQVRAGGGRGGTGVGDLVGLRRGDAHARRLHSELARDHLRDLDVEPLAHLGATVVDLNRAIREEVHERAGLVEVLEGEGDAELDRSERDPFPQMPGFRVAARNVPASPGVVATPLERPDQARRDVVAHPHAVRGDVAPGTVEVALSHRQRIESEADGDLVHHALREEHALRASESAKRGVRHGVGAHPAGVDARVRVVVGVVGVEHRAVDHSEREVGRTAAPGIEIDGHSGEASLVVGTEPVGDPEVVALAGHDHVVVAVEADFGRTSGHVGGEGGEAGPLRGLRLLAAEAPAHAAAFAHDPGERDTEHPGHQSLHVRRMLGGGVQEHLPRLPRYREGDLTLQVEVLLTADA